MSNENKDMQIGAKWTTTVLDVNVSPDIADFIEHEFPRLSGHDWDYPIEIDPEEIVHDHAALKEMADNWNKSCHAFGNMKIYTPGLLDRLIKSMASLQTHINNDGDIDVIHFHLL